MKMQKTILSLLAALCFSIFANAATYYVSSSGGNDKNSGLSSSSPWKTLSKLNSFSFKSGDRILFKKGDTWYEQLNISSSGSSASPIEFSSYGSGNDPVISGAAKLSGFAKYSGNIWRKYTTSSPQQVFFNGERGVKAGSVSGVNTFYAWYWSSNYLYVYTTSDPGSYISVTSRYRGIYITGDYIKIEGLQIEKVSGTALEIAPSSVGTIIDNCEFYQWSMAVDGTTGAINIGGSYAQVKNCIFGKNTGNDIADQKWAGLVGIVLEGKSSSINNNKFYHSAIENESGAGFYGSAIRILSSPGITRIYQNYIYHSGSHGISTTAYSVEGDEMHIYENKIEYPGQSGISAYRTRGADGKGGKGYIYKNNVSYSNRLGGDVGAKGTQASGIHFNDGTRANTDPAKPYQKWYCYENVVHHNMGLKVPNSPDACGISMDFNANGVEVYRNLVYSNYSKGIEMWNANNCKVSYNIVYGNDAGINVTCMSGGVESATNNQIYNNTCYKNYNGNDKGPNLHTEIYFGLRGKNNIIKNNILYAANEGFAYVYNVENTGGHIVDNNVVYSENGVIARDGQYGRLTFAQWRQKRPSWDVHSTGTNPQFTNPAAGDFSLKTSSPAINKGAVLGFVNDFLVNALNGVPDIGALEFGSSGTPQEDKNTTGGNDVIILNAWRGTLTGDAMLGSMTGQSNERSVFFDGTKGGTVFTVDIPKSGEWYAWARMYYMSSGKKNSFYLSVKTTAHVLGDNDNKYNQWHWDGYKGSKINLGHLEAGPTWVRVSGREPGRTLWVDRIVFTNNPNYNPNTSLGKELIAEEEVEETTAESSLPTEFEISQNFPNPFNPATTIKYAVAASAHVSLKIYDILGAEVATLVDEMKNPGYYEVKFDGTGLASGIYIYQLRTNDFVETKKMNLLK